jgi:hypothetical protein
MAVITRRVGLGRNLTAAEVDANFDGVNDELATKAGTSTFTSVAAGLVPASGGGSSTYLCADGTFNTPPGAGDMVLDQIQTNIAAKTFPTGTLIAASPVITTPSGIVKGDVGLGNADNTSDANKPVSTAQQAALDLKANIASPTFTGTVSGITATMVGLGNVNNTSDANKPVSTAAQTALDLKANLASPTFTGTPAAPTAAAATNTTQVATTAHVFAERTNAATLTNKTLTSPTINTPTITSPTMTGTVTVPDASWSNAKLATMANNTVKGNVSGSTAAPSDVTLTALAALLQTMLASSGYGSVFKPYASSGATVTISAGAGVAEQVASISLPALGANAEVVIRYKVKKVGTNGTLSFNVKLGGTSLYGNGAVSPAASTLAVDGCIAFRNRNSTSSQIGMASTQLGLTGSSTLVFGTATAATGVAGVAVTIELTRASTSDTVSLEGYTVEIYDPDATTTVPITVKDEGSTLTTSLTSIDFTGSGVTASNTGGAVTVNITGGGGSSNFTPVDEAAARALVSADDGTVLRYTGAGAGSFTIAAGQSFPNGVTVIWGGVGRPTITCATGVTLDGVDAGTVTPAARYNRVAIQTVATNDNVVVQ